MFYVDILFFCKTSHVPINNITKSVRYYAGEYPEILNHSVTSPNALNMSDYMLVAFFYKNKQLKQENLYHCMTT